MKNPRITVTLTPSLNLLLDRLSLASGNSKSGLIAELLEESEPVFNRVLVVLEAAERVKSQMQLSVKDGLLDAQQKLEAQLGLTLEEFEKTGDLFAEIEQVARRSRKGGGRVGRKAGAGGALGGVPCTTPDATPAPKRGRVDPPI